MPKIHFVQELQDSSHQRAKELERSRARAHAAFVSHQKRRARDKEDLILNKPTFFQGKDYRKPSLSRGIYYYSSSSSDSDSEGSIDSAASLIKHDVDQNYAWLELEQQLLDLMEESTSIPRDYQGFRSDPFACIPGSRSHDVSTVIDYHTQVMGPNQAPIYKIFNVTNVYTAYLFELLSKEEFLHAGVASVQAVIDHFRQPGKGPSNMTLKHLGEAIVNMRRRITELTGRDRSGKTVQADDTTIITILFLAVCTRAIGDWAGHEAHKRSLAALVAARGGLDKIDGHDGFARAMLMQRESQWALNTGVTIFPADRPGYRPEYPTIPLSKPMLQKVLTLPSGFQTLAHNRMLALDVIEVLTRTAAAEVEYGLHGTIVRPIDVFGHKKRPYSDFWEACTCFNAPDEIITVASESGYTTDIAVPNLQKLIILSLILYCLSRFSPTRSVTAMYSGCRMKLITDLPRRLAVTDPHKHIKKEDEDVHEMSAEERALLWITWVLIDAWRAPNEILLPQGLELLKLSTIYFPKLVAWAEIEAVLRSFFSNQAFLSRCEGFWLSTLQDVR